MAMTIHTFELTTKLSAEDTASCRNAFFGQAIGHARLCYQKGMRLYFNRWSNRGVRIFLNKNENIPDSTLHLCVTPAKVLGCDDAAALFEATERNVSALEIQLEKILDELPIKRRSSQMKLSRLDLCRNALVSKQIYIDEYLRLLKKGGSVFRWEVQAYPDDDERNLHSFRRVNGEYQVTVYDKLFQIAHEGYHTDWSGSTLLLRIEVSLFRSGIVQELERLSIRSDFPWTNQIVILATYGEAIMRQVMKKIVPDSKYCSLKQAKEYIQQAEDLSPAKRTHLIQFLLEVNQYDVLDAKHIKDFTNGKKRLKQLKKLGINPVTIEARAGISYLPSLPQLISLGFVPPNDNPAM